MLRKLCQCTLRISHSSFVDRNLVIKEVGYPSQKILLRFLHKWQFSYAVIFSEIPDSDAGVYSGLTGYPSTAMADQVAAASQGSFRWAIQLPEQRFAPGHIELQLRLAREAPSEPTPLTVTASYVHLGMWRHSAGSVTCAW